MTPAIPDLDLPPDHPLQQIIDLITAHPEVREPLLRVLLTEEFLALPGQVRELREDLDDFRQETREQFRVVNERLDEHNRRLDDVNSRLDEHNRQLDEHNRRLDDVSSRLDENTRILRETNQSTRRLEGHVGRLRGISYEDNCRYYIGVILDGWLDGPVLADRELISAKLREARRNNLITRQEYLHGLSPDIVARAVDDAAHTERLAVVEASVTFNQRDLENAVQRAAIIARVTGVPTDAFVATHHPWPDDIDAAAQQLGVTIIQHESEEHADD